MSLFWLIIAVVLLLGLAYLIFIIVLLVKRNFILALLFLFFPYFSFKAFQYYWFTEILPAPIEVSYPLSMGQESGIVMKGCGVAVFKLSESTLAEIEREGLDFLNRATISRGYNDPYYQFEQWSETPVPQDWVSEGAWFMCAVPNESLVKKIIKAAKESGSYYTKKREGELMVIPSLGYVVLSYNG